jgi:hypothetical protein
MKKEILIELREPAPWVYVVRYGYYRYVFAEIYDESAPTTDRFSLSSRSLLYGLDEGRLKYLHSEPHPDEIWKIIVAVLAIREKAAHLEKYKARLEDSATKRLMRDWREVRNNPLSTISAHPLYDYNMFEWHVELVLKIPLMLFIFS